MIRLLGRLFVADLGHIIDLERSRLRTDHISLERVQWEERVQRRHALDRELSETDAQECIARVKRRMLEGTACNLAPLYDPESFYAAKRRERRRARISASKVTPFDIKREA